MEFAANVHAQSMLNYGRKHKDTLVLSGDLTASTEISQFKKELPQQFVSMGMAEQNMLSWAGGLAREGYVPFIHTFAVFLYRRPFDQLSMSIAYPNLKVRLCGFLPGIMTPGGVTHQAIEDISVLRGIPNLTILETGDATDVETVLDATTEIEGPVYIRVLRGTLPRLFPKDQPFKVNTARVLTEGDDFTIFTSGICTEEGYKAALLLKAKGFYIKVVHISTLKPFTDPSVVHLLKQAGEQVITVENHSIIGGLGTCVSEVVAEKGLAVKVFRLGIPDTYAQGASKEYLQRKFGIDAQGIIEKIQQITNTDFSISPSDYLNVYAREAENFVEDRLEAL